jgi:hypothetical protein
MSFWNLWRERLGVPETSLPHLIQRRGQSQPKSLGSHWFTSLKPRSKNAVSMASDRAMRAMMMKKDPSPPEREIHFHLVTIVPTDIQ